MKKTTLFMLVTLSASSFIMSCNNAENAATTEVSKPAFDLTAARKEIEEANQKFTAFFAKGDSVGIANLYTTDAKLMFADAPAVIGRQNIQSAFAGLMNSGITNVSFKTIDVFGSEELLAEEGEVTVYVKDQVVGVDKYIVLFKKEDGKWKFFRDIANSNSPAPASK